MREGVVVGLCVYLIGDGVGYRGCYGRVGSYCDEVLMGRMGVDVCWGC